MTIKKTLLLGAMAIVIAPAAAQADGPYISAGVGYDFPGDLNAAPSETGAIPAGINIEFDEDVSFSGAIGYGIDLAGPLDPRFEFEFSYRENDVDEILINGNDVSGNGPVGGDFEVLTYMVNALVDYDTGSRFKPYAGVGVGFADIESNAAYLNGGGVQFNLRESDTVLAAQGIVGVSYGLTDKIEIFGDARYLATAEAEFERANALGATTDHDGDYDTFTIGTGIRYKF